MLSYGAKINESQKSSVQKLLKYMNNDLRFLEGGGVNLPDVRQAQRFAGSAAKTSQFIELLKKVDLWKIQIRFRDFEEAESAFLLLDHHSEELKTIEINIGRKDFSPEHFAEHLTKQE